MTYATGQSAFPYLIGLDQATATQKAKDAGFANVTVKTVVTTNQQAGTVINTDPVPNTVADRTKPVTIYVATAPSAPPSSATPNPSASSSPSKS